MGISTLTADDVHERGVPACVEAFSQAAGCIIVFWKKVARATLRVLVVGVFMIRALLLRVSLLEPLLFWETPKWAPRARSPRAVLHQAVWRRWRQSGNAPVYLSVDAKLHSSKPTFFEVQGC